MSTLAEWVIQMSAAGNEALLTAMGQAAAGLAALETASVLRDRKEEERKQAGLRREKELQAAEQKRSQEALRNQLAVAGAYSLLAGSVMSYVRAGLQGTAQGEMIGLQMQQISREVANLFLPMINASVDALQRVNQWFKNLSGAQQENIGRWLATGVAALGVLKLLPQLAAGFKMLGLAANAAVAGNPVGLILVAATALVAMVASTERGQQSLARLGESFAKVAAAALRLGGPLFDALNSSLEGVAATLETVTNWMSGAADEAERWLRALNQASAPLSAAAQILRNAFGLAMTGSVAPPARQDRERRELSPRGGGTEQVTQIFHRLQEAANRTDIPQRQLNELEQIRRNTEQNVGAALLRGALYGLTGIPPVGA